jgi:hypothetical protein
MGASIADGDVASGREPLTDELLDHLLASPSLEQYLSDLAADDLSLTTYVADLLDKKGLTRSEVIRSSGLNATFCYQVFQGTRHPGRDNAIMLAFGLRCDLHQTQRLLTRAGMAELWCRRRRDAIIIFCIEHGRTRVECDDELWRLGESTLMSEEG